MARPCSTSGAFGGALGWPLTLAMIELVGWRGACFGWAALHLLGRLGLDPAEAAGAATLMAGAAVAVRLLAFLAPGKGSPVGGLRLATLLHPLGAAVAFFGGKSLAGAVALGQGAGNGLLSVASGVLPLHLFGKENYATRQALILTPARFLQAAAPLSYGVLLDRSAGLALLASSAVCVLMFAMTFGLERRP